MASILKLASKAAGWTWQNSGASRIPALEGARKVLTPAQKDGDKLSRKVDAKPALEPAKPQTPSIVPESQGKKSGWTEERRRMQADMIKQLKPHLAPRKDTVKENRQANEAAIKASTPEQKPNPEAGMITKRMEEDIHEIRELIEKQGLNGRGEGPSLLGGLAGNALKGLAGRIPGIGRIAAMLAGGAGIAGVGKSILGTLSSATAGAAAGAAPAASKGILGAAQAAGRSALGVGRSAVEALGGLRAAGAAKMTTVAEGAKSLATKAAGAASGSGTALAKLAGKAGIKSLIKKIPAIGLLAGVGFGVQRAMAGDWTGAGMEVASGLAGTIPGAGTAASLGIDAALAAKDATASPDLEKIMPSAALPSSKPEVQAGLANLQSFVTAAMDEKQGIFVRIAKNELTDNVSNSAANIQRVSAPQTSAEIRKPAQPAQPSTVPTGVSAQRAADAAAGLRPVTSADPQFQKVTPTTDLARSELAALIQRGEGDYNSYNAGTKGVDGGKVRHSGKKNLSEMTLNEIIKSSEERDGNDKDRVFAAGRYQIITPTLKASMKKMGLKGDEKFTPELQDKIFQETLLPQSVRDYVGGKSDDMKSAQVDLAKVWRSFADPRTGKTYADSGAGANHASISAAESAKALSKTRDQVAAAKAPALQLAQPEQRVSDVLKAETQEAKKAAGSNAAPAVIQVPVAVQSPAPNSSGGAAGIGGHMGTRNDDSSIRRITDAKMGYSAV